jgi:hypothetical protein
MSTQTEPQPGPIKRLSVPLPPDLYEIVRTLAFEQRTTKQDIVVSAVRKVYGEQLK